MAAELPAAGWFGAVRRVVDLSMVVSEGDNPVYPGRPWLKYEPIATHDTAAFASSAASIFLHAGTHVDAPSHFDEKGLTVDQIPVATLVGEAVVLDMSHAGPGHTISAEELERDAEAQEAAGNAIRPGDKVLIRTGWASVRQPPDRRWWDEAPSLSRDGARWLVSKRVSAVGFDFPQDRTTREIDRLWHARQEGIPLTDLSDPPLPVHVTLLFAGIPQIECMTNLDQIEVRRVFLVGAPLRLKGAEGANARALALY